MSDELTGIFDNLNPDDFKHGGKPAFNQFVFQKIEATKTGYLMAEGDIVPVACLRSTTDEEQLVPLDEVETLGDFVERIGVRAREMGATWLFVALKTGVATYEPVDPDNLPDVSNEDAYDGELSDGVFFYAERFEDGNHDRRSGIMRDVDGRLVGLTEQMLDQSVNLFSKTLG